MSCDKCIKIQELNRKGKALAYLEIQDSKILIGACDFHYNIIRANILPDAELKSAIVNRINKVKS